MQTVLIVFLVATSIMAKAQVNYITRGRQVASLVESGNAFGIWNLLLPQAQTAFGSPQNLANALAILQGDSEICAESENSGLQPGGVMYSRTATFTSGRMIKLSVAIAANGQVGGIWLSPVPGRSQCVQTYRTRTNLRLPMNGSWVVLWGGRTLAQNYHVGNTADQWFAYDFAAMSPAGTTYMGNPNLNQSYMAYGRDVVAPAPGIVVEVVDGIPENIPGLPNLNPQQAAGNYVVIDHGNGEFSLLAHMQPATILVRTGQQVAMGQRIGKCGNSGHSTEPHLHYQLMSTRRIFAGMGFPAQFTSLIINGQPAVNAEPVKGQIIQP